MKYLPQLTSPKLGTEQLLRSPATGFLWILNSPSPSRRQGFCTAAPSAWKSLPLLSLLLHGARRSLRTLLSASRTSRPQTATSHPIYHHNLLTSSLTEPNLQCYCIIRFLPVSSDRQQMPPEEVPGWPPTAASTEEGGNERRWALPRRERSGSVLAFMQHD